ERDKSMKLRQGRRTDSRQDIKASRGELVITPRIRVMALWLVDPEEGGAIDGLVVRRPGLRVEEAIHRGVVMPLPVRRSIDLRHLFDRAIVEIPPNIEQVNGPPSRNLRLIASVWSHVRVLDHDDLRPVKSIDVPVALLAPHQREKAKRRVQ